MTKQLTQRLLLTFTCCLIFLGGLSFTPAVTAQGERQHNGVWLWNTPMIRDSSNSILAFASNNGVNEIYLQMNRDVKPEFYKSFISRAGALGIEIHVLGGAPKWALESERYNLDIFINWIAEYQSTAAPNERFTGIHLDVEPHVLSEWRTNQPWLIQQWQNSITYLMDGLRPLNLPITFDIPFWLHNNKLPDQSMTMSRWLMSKADGVAIMAYRDQASKIYNLAIPELLEADQMGKKALIAVETKQSNEGAFITFFEEGAAYMNRQLRLVNDLAANHPSFSGFAIHEYKAYKELVESGK